MRVITAMAAVTVLLSLGRAYAHDEHQHGKHHPDTQMAKLHKMMPRYAKTQAQIEQALAKGDLKAVAKQADFLLSTTADLKKAKPHKNLARLDEFKKEAGEFEAAVGKVAESAKKGDLAAARAAFASATQFCASCHAAFRGH